MYLQQSSKNSKQTIATTEFKAKLRVFNKLFIINQVKYYWSDLPSVVLDNTRFHGCCFIHKYKAHVRGALASVSRRKMWKHWKWRRAVRVAAAGTRVALLGARCPTSDSHPSKQPPLSLISAITWTLSHNNCLHNLFVINYKPYLHRQRRHRYT